MIGDLGDLVYEVQSMETSGELDRNRLNLTLNLSSLIQSPSITSVDSITPKEECQSGIFVILLFYVIGNNLVYLCVLLLKLKFYFYTPNSALLILDVNNMGGCFK